ncbi:MAG: hypothetical protein GY725_23770 [bacterium]|nr:hypothetical protein [bacterium]
MNKWMGFLCGFAGVVAAAHVAWAEMPPAVEIQADRELADEIRADLEAQERQQIETDLSPIHGELPAISPEQNDEFDQPGSFDSDSVDGTTDPDELLIGDDGEPLYPRDDEEPVPDSKSGKPVPGAAEKIEQDADEDYPADESGAPGGLIDGEIEAGQPNGDIETMDPDDLDVDRSATGSDEDD